MKNKKKGFTLIELIAVIAILAILGMVLVPKITGYQNKAKRSNVQSSAKVILNAIKAYNSDATTKIAGTASFDTALITTINTDGKIINATDATITKSLLPATKFTCEEIAAIAEGTFTMNGDVVTITGSATASIE